MKILIYLALSFSLTFCSHKICTENVSVNRDTYKRYLIILKESQYSQKFVMPKEVNEAIRFLEIVSGIHSRSEVNENLTYRNKADLKADIKMWEHWYYENKCRLTLHYVDSAFNSLGLKR